MADLTITLPQDIKNFKGLLQWLLLQPKFAKPAVTVLAELYQGTSELLPPKSKSEGGLCHGMAVEWIKSNGRAGGQVQFRKTAATDWKSFATTQEIVNHKKEQGRLLAAKEVVKFKSLQTENNALKEKEKYASQTGFFAGVQHLFDPPMSPSQLQSAHLAIKQKTSETSARFAKLKDAGIELYAASVFDDPADYHRMTRVQNDSSLSFIGIWIQIDEGDQPAYYLINMIPPDGKGLGHAIAIHGAHRPRLMDANGCELQFASMATLYTFLDEYWKIYERFGFGEMKVDLYRYDIRLSGGDVHDANSTARAKFNQGMAAVRSKPILDNLLT